MNCCCEQNLRCSRCCRSCFTPPHAHSATSRPPDRMSASSPSVDIEDLASPDEVKVFRDEGQERKNASASEMGELSETLINEEEQQQQQQLQLISSQTHPSPHRMTPHVSYDTCDDAMSHTWNSCVCVLCSLLCLFPLLAVNILWKGSGGESDSKCHPRYAGGRDVAEHMQQTCPAARRQLKAFRSPLVLAGAEEI